MKNKTRDRPACCMHVPLGDFPRGALGASAMQQKGRPLPFDNKRKVWTSTSHSHDTKYSTLLLLIATRLRLALNDHSTPSVK